jgi:hypothetical protein
MVRQIRESTSDSTGDDQIVTNWLLSKGIHETPAILGESEKSQSKTDGQSLSVK